MRSSSSTTESGGSPPSFSETLIDPLVGWKRIPSSWRLDLCRDEIRRTGGVDVEMIGRSRTAAESELARPIHAER
jgi:hypothetical protein